MLGAWCLFILLTCFAASIARGAVTLTALHSFSGPDGSGPLSLMQASAGNFYGTTSDPSWASGTVFRLTPSGEFMTLVGLGGFSGVPQSGVVEGSDGNFYGTTRRGGAFGKGTVFMTTHAGALTTLVSFNGTNGAEPYAGLVQGKDGNFYGTTKTPNHTFQAPQVRT